MMKIFNFFPGLFTDCVTYDLKRLSIPCLGLIYQR